MRLLGGDLIGRLVLKAGPKLLNGLGILGQQLSLAAQATDNVRGVAPRAIGFFIPLAVSGVQPIASCDQKHGNLLIFGHYSTLFTYSLPIIKK